MGQNNRMLILEKLIEDESVRELDHDKITHINMVENFKIIQKYLSVKLYNEHLFKSFVTYFLTKIILVKVHIDEPKDVH